MSAKTKIIVLHMKEVIYTGIFLLLAVILAIVLFFMFGPGQKKSASADAKSLYKPGIYTSSIELNSNTFDLEVSVDAEKIRNIRLVNLSESTSAMFPLIVQSHTLLPLIFLQNKLRFRNLPRLLLHNFSS